MKKLFTLISMALFATAIQAQDAEALLFDQSATVADGQEFTTASAKLTLGADQKEWKVAAAGIKEDAYYKDFGKTVQIKNSETDETEDKFGIVTVTGSNNPKDQKEAGKGSGVNYAEDKTVGRLPQNGTYYIFTAQKSGKVQAGIILNADKAFYLVDATNATASEDGTYLEVALPDANLHSYVIKDKDGNEVELVDDGDGKGGKTVSEKVTGVLEFEAQAGHTYYYFCSGSKLGIFGYIFTPTAETVTETWTVAGSTGILGSEWKTDDTANDMTTTDGKIYTLVKENCTLEKGTTYEFKVAKDHAWTEAYPSQNAKLTVPETAIYKVTITFNSETKEVSATYEKTGEAGVIEHTYDVKGNFFNDTNWEQTYAMTKDATGLWTVTIENLDAGNYEFKVREDNAWSVSYPASNYKVSVETSGSSLTIAFNPETKEISTTVTTPSGINSVCAARQVTVLYNLAGQKVDANYKGVVIMNDKKVLMK